MTRDFGVRLPQRQAPIAAIGLMVMAAALIVIKVAELRADRRATMSEASAWTIRGAPCPVVDSVDDIGFAVPRLKRFEFEGGRFARAYGYVLCQVIHDRGGVGPGRITVCQFNSPTVLDVVTGAGHATFLTGAHPATISIAGGRAACVMGAAPGVD
jgi:hypothetical protein